MTEHTWIAYRQEFLPFAAAITRWTCAWCRATASNWAERNTADRDGCWPEAVAA